MTLVEDYSVEALSEIKAVLLEMKRRQNDCLVSSTYLRGVLKRRFGISSEGSRYLLEYVVGFLMESGLLSLWDLKPKTRIYKVNKIG